MTRECILFDENMTCLLASKLYSESFSLCYIWASYIKLFIDMVRNDLQKTVEDKSQNILINARPSETILLNEATRLLKKQKVSCIHSTKQDVLLTLDKQPLSGKKVTCFIEELKVKCLENDTPLEVYIGLQRIQNIIESRITTGMNSDTLAWICELAFIEASMNSQGHAEKWFEIHHGSEQNTDYDIVYPFFIEPCISSFTTKQNADGTVRSVSFRATREQRTVNTQFSVLNQEFRIIYVPDKQHVEIHSKETDTDVKFGFIKPGEIFSSVLRSDVEIFLKTNNEGILIVPSRLRGRWSRLLQSLRPHSISIDSEQPRKRAIVTPWGRATYCDNITAFPDPNPVTTSLYVVANLDTTD